MDNGRRLFNVIIWRVFEKMTKWWCFLTKKIKNRRSPPKKHVSWIGIYDLHRGSDHLYMIIRDNYAEYRIYFDIVGGGACSGNGGYLYYFYGACASLAGEFNGGGGVYVGNCATFNG